jgi:uncharacterized protein (DUF433 family)
MQATKHVEITPGVCSGRPRVAGTRIRVANVVLWTEQGMSPDEIVIAYPQLSLADVHGALAFYHDHRVEMDQLIQQDAEFVAGMMVRTADPT